MGLFRKDRHSHDSAQENSEPSKKSQAEPVRSVADDLLLSRLNSNKRNWAESPPDNYNRFSVQNYSVADYVREQEEKARYEKYHNIQEQEKQLRNKILSKTPARQVLEQLNYDTLDDESYLIATLDTINTYFSGFGGTVEVFNPFNSNPAAKAKLDKFIFDMSMNGFPRYVPTNEDYQKILDPLSYAAFRNPNSLTNGLGEYINPYKGSISFEYKPRSFPESSFFLLKLGLETVNPILNTRYVDVIATKHVTFLDAENFTSINDVFLLFDQMIQKYEKSKDFYLTRQIEKDIVSQFMGGKKDSRIDIRAFEEAMRSANASMQELYYQQHMKYDPDSDEIRRRREDERRTPHAAPPPPPKVKKLMLCPDHGGAMMRKKGDDEHLHCPVMGCTKVLKRKVPRDANTPRPRIRVAMKYPTQSRMFGRLSKTLFRKG